MNVRLYVVAGNLYEFQEFRKRKLDTSYWHQTMFPDARDWVFVSSPNSLRGCTVEHGTFIGSWRKLPELQAIFSALMVACSRDNQTFDNINKIYNDWQDEVAKELLNVNVSKPTATAPITGYNFDRGWSDALGNRDQDMDFLMYAKMVEQSSW